MFQRLHCGKAAAFVALCSVSFGFQALANEGLATVEQLHTTLISSMQPGQDFTARCDQLEPVITEIFDVQTIARVSLGRHWRGLDADGQARVAQALTRLLVSTFAARFDKFNNHRFETLGEETMSGNRRMVKTLLVTPSETVSLDYMLTQRDDTWRIYDIVAQGVSDLSLKRSAYSDAFASGGIDEVLELIHHATPAAP